MDYALIASILVGVVVLLVLFTAVAAHRLNKDAVPNYRALFVLGICFLPIGIAGGNTGLWVVGAVFLLVGLSKRDQWGEETKWADFPPRLKRIKLTVAAVSVVLLLLAMVLFMLAK